MKLLDDKVAYPDFLLNRTQDWWIEQIVEYRKVNISFDALWIDMKYNYKIQKYSYP